MRELATPEKPSTTPPSLSYTHGRERERGSEQSNSFIDFSLLPPPFTLCVCVWMYTANGVVQHEEEGRWRRRLWFWWSYLNGVGYFISLLAGWLAGWLVCVRCSGPLPICIRRHQKSEMDLYVVVANSVFSHTASIHTHTHIQRVWHNIWYQSTSFLFTGREWTEENARQKGVLAGRCSVPSSQNGAVDMIMNLFFYRLDAPTTKASL